MSPKNKFTPPKLSPQWLKKRALGKDGFLVKTYLYLTLIGVGFVFLFPLIYMISFSFKSLSDLLNFTVNLIPTSLYMGNYQRYFEVVNFFPRLLETFYIAAVPSILQTLIAAIIGYGFARFNFFGKKFLLVLVLATFIIPPQVLVIPRHILFNDLGMLESILAYALPAAFGQGINSAIFILIFYQTFRLIPKALEEAAQLDGAGHLKIFFKVGVPLAGSAVIVSLLFSFVWYWNETFLAAIYFRDALTTLPLQLQRFVESFNEMFARHPDVNVNEGVEMAGTFLTIVPLLILYFIMQRWFVESVDKSGIAGE